MFSLKSDASLIDWKKDDFPFENDTRIEKKMALTERHELALNTETKTAVLPDNPLFYPTIYV